ncbi:MAG: tetratricopeptide repeat protein, partial [candidate division Zixibacteria bacterium]|nr:tetratricopeptide repeat protein [candidate division Zixibacteria bacterium]
MKKSLVAVILLLVSGIPAGLAAQSQEPQPSPFKEMVPLNPNDDQRMAVVRKLMRIRNYQAAADMLETIYQTDPSNAVVQNLLRTCYDNLKQYDKAEMLLRRMIEQNPRALGHRLGLAEVLIKQGNRDDGLAAYGVAIDMVPLDDVARQMPLVLSLISSGLTDQALIHIDAIRQATGDSTAFAVQKCQVLESRQEYASAAYEYLPLLLQDTTRDANTAERRLVALLEFSGSAVPVEGVLVGAATDTSGSRIMRLLTDYYVKAGRFDEAFAFALRHDSLTGGSGVPLLSYARQCAERHSWLQAERMGQILQAGYKDAPVYMEALFRLADAQAHLDRYAEAMATYERILAEAKHDQDRADALLGLGMVRFAYTHEYAVALTYFDSVAVHYPRGLAYLNARRSIPYCYLRSGDLTGARREFEKLAQLKLNDDLREEVLYNLARVSLFEKQYDSAEVSLRKLMVDFPRGFYVNDALQLVLLLGQAEGADDL